MGKAKVFLCSLLRCKHCVGYCLRLRLIVFWDFLDGCFVFVGSPKFFFLLNGFAKKGFGGEALLLGGLDDVEELFSQRRGVVGDAVGVF